MKFWKSAKITRRGKDNQESNPLTQAIAEKQAKKDFKKAKKKG